MEPPPLPPREAAPASSLPIRRAATRRPLRSEARAPAPGDVGATSLPPRIENRETDAPVARKTETAIPAADPLTALLARLAERIDIDSTDPAAMKNQERWSATRSLKPS